MQLTETNSQHPNLIQEANHRLCRVASNTIEQSLLLPWQGELQLLDITAVEHLDEPMIKRVADLKPELLVLATGKDIAYPSTKILTPLLNNNIGLEVMPNAAAARTFNVLMAENRQVVCLMLIG